MKMKLKLEKTQEIDGQKSHYWVYTFVPTNEDWKGKLTLTVKTSDPYEDMGTLGLPQKKNDTILIPWDKDQEQTELGKTEEKVAKKPVRKGLKDEEK